VQSVGVGFEDLSPDAAVARYGERPYAIYLYNVLATTSHVLFAEPARGVFRILAAFTTRTVQPWHVTHLASSVTLSLVLVAWAFARLRQRDADPRERRLVGLFAVAIAMSSLLAFNYTRDRFEGVAAVFYAAAAYYAVRWLVAGSRPQPAWRFAATTTLVLVVSVSWNLRAVGTIYGLRETAWAVRKEWLADTYERRQEFSGRSAYLAAIDALYAQGVHPRAAAPHEWPSLSRVLGDW
jgi:hypothetical protein